MAYIGKSPTRGVRQRYIYTATGSETSISASDTAKEATGKALSFTDGAYVDVYKNGALLEPNEAYNTNTTNTIAGLSSLSANDIIEVIVFDIFTTADAVSAVDGGTFSGAVTFDSDATFTGANYNVVWDKSDNALEFADQAKLDFGAGDFKIYHYANSFIENYSGGLYIDQYADNLDIHLRADDSSGGLVNYFKADGSEGEALLYHYGTEKLATKSTGINVTGTVIDDGATHDGDVTFTGASYNVLWDKSDNALEFADNAKAVFGAGNDTSIVHDASNTLINHTGAGDLKIQHGGADQLVVTAAGVTMDETLTTRGLIVTQQAKGISAFNYRYIRVTNFTFVQTSNGVNIRNIKFNTAADGSGTEYPSDMTADDAPSPYVASAVGTHSASYAAWHAFTGDDAGGGWWNLGSPLSTDYIQIDLGSSFNTNLNRIDLTINSTYSVTGFTIKGSANGNFSGEEVTISTITDNDTSVELVTLRSDQGAAFTFALEGATADAYETTLAVVDPTADRTITLPDVTGTVITTGNLSSITSLLATDIKIGEDDNTKIDFGTANAITFNTDGSERMRMLSDGNIVIGRTSNDLTAAGCSLEASGTGAFVRDGGPCIITNRLSSDGEIIRINKDDTTIGTISVSGSTVSYNAFSGSHWSRLADNSKPTILRGTVMETIDEMCDWYQAEYTSQEDIITKDSIALPEGKKVGDTITHTVDGVDYTAKILQETDYKHPKCKISDTADCTNVYGVFLDWDNDDKSVNDMYVNAVGTNVVRIHKDQTVAKGDLLTSNGDGTAKKQDDDIIRSKTIGKVLSNKKQETYSDGSYVVPCALYCG